MVVSTWFVCAESISAVCQVIWVTVLSVHIVHLLYSRPTPIWSDCITYLMLSVCTIRCSNFWLFELTCLEVYFSLCEWQASPEHHGSWEDMLTSWLLMPWCSPPERQYYNLVPRQIHCVLWVVLSSKVTKQFMECRQITLETRLTGLL